MDKFLRELIRQIDGEILTDRLSRRLYATDASPFQQLPIAIARPANTKDCIAIVRLAKRFNRALIPRAAGTSLAGQCVGDGLIVDTSRHLNNILHIDTEKHRAVVQPGVVCEQLNTELVTHNLVFGPDPSTSNYCTLGGMAGNNAWGIHSQRYGATRDNIESMEVVLGDGRLTRFGPVDNALLRQKCELDNYEGRIYRTVTNIINTQRQLIEERISSPDGIYRNTGYALDVLAQMEPWRQDGPAFNLAPFLCGSEGTLALTTALEVKLVAKPDHRVLFCAHFDSIDQALESVPEVLKHDPTALEIIDHHILERSKYDIQQRRNRFWLSGDPQAVLLIELHANSRHAEASLKNAAEQLRAETPAYVVTIVEAPEINQVWALRKAGLGMLMGVQGGKKAVTGIEDCAVGVADLATYCADIKRILASYDTDCVVYGPAGRGTLHLRPELDLSNRSGQRRYRKILDKVATTVISYNGSLSAKHGDGRLRGYLLERQLGSEILALLHRVKHAFDPSGILNPGKILDTPKPDHDFRPFDSSTARKFNKVFDWSADGGLAPAIQKCNGAGVCLQSASNGSMCPSYQATREEKNGTRGRANILRQFLSSAAIGDLTEYHEAKQVLDLCLSCKACKSECPAGVDMARIKAEFMQHYNENFGVPFRSQLIGNFDQLSRFAMVSPKFANRLLSFRWIKRALGIATERRLPHLALTPFSRWWKHHIPHLHKGGRGDVVLILDPLMEFYEPHIAIAAVRVLEAMNYRTTVTPSMSLGRSLISQNMLHQAGRQIEHAVKYLYPFAEKKIPLVGLEPSEILTLRDEAVDLIADDSQKKRIKCVAKQAMLFDEFIAQNQRKIGKKPLKLNPTPSSVMIHGHCHQKSLVGMHPSLTALSKIPNLNITSIPSGCCGMAGAFGYEREHYDISLKIGELALFPAIRNAPKDTLLVATGASCRYQILDGLGRRAYHPAEILAMGITI